MLKLRIFGTRFGVFGMAGQLRRLADDDVATGPVTTCHRNRAGWNSELQLHLTSAWSQMQL